MDPSDRSSSRCETMPSWGLDGTSRRPEHGKCKSAAQHLTFRRKEMRKLLIACGLAFLGAVTASAQESRGFEVSGNYQYVRFNPGNGADGVNCQGGSGSAAAYLTSQIGIVGEFGGCKVTGLPSGASAHDLSYLFGPRVYFHSNGRLF